MDDPSILKFEEFWNHVAKYNNKNLKNHIERGDGEMIYLSDKPILGEKDDLFNRRPFAKRLAETLASRTDPSGIVIGLYGAWGCGKTSVLEMMKEVLCKDEKVVTVSFNPWIFGSQEMLLKSFFATLAEALDKSIQSNKEKIGELLNQYGNVVSVAASALTSAPLPIGEILKLLGRVLSSTSIEKQKQAIESIINDSGKRIIVLIDDIDRLDNAEIHAIFKLVKMTANFEYTSYVLAFDHDIVAAALGERYGKCKEDGKAFLEKIIQVPLHLPLPDSRSLETIIDQSIENALNLAEIELDKEQVLAFNRVYQLCLRYTINTPRLAKLYGNALSFALPLLKGEVNPADLMLIEAVRIFYPDLYKQIYNNMYIFISEHYTHDERMHTLDQICNGIPENKRESFITYLLAELFPRLKSVSYPSEWDIIWDQQKKICSEKYFKKYFLYSIPSESISDVSFHNLLNENEPNKAVQIIQSFSRNSLNDFIQKLWLELEKFDNEQAKLWLGIMPQVITADIPRKRFHGMDITLGEVGQIIYKLLQKIKTDVEREQYAKDSIEQFDLEFSVKIYRQISDKVQNEEEAILSPDSVKCLQTLLVGRIIQEDLLMPLYKKYDIEICGTCYGIWQDECGGDSLKQALIKHLDDGPTDVDAFLRCFAGEWHSYHSGNISYRFDKCNIDTLSKFIETSFVAQKLVEVYGAELSDPQEYPSNEMPPEKQLAHQFMYCYKQDKEAQQAD